MKQSTTKNTVFNTAKIMGGLLVALIVVACNKTNQQEENPLQKTVDSLKAVNASQAQELDEFMGLVDQVNEGFRMIKEAEGRVDIQDGNIETNKREQIAENMQFIQETMAQNRQLIEQMKSKIAKSGNKLSSLSKQVEMLEQQLNDQRTRVQELEALLAESRQQNEMMEEENLQLRVEKTQVVEENAQLQTVNNEQDKELNTAWFVFGTKAELKEQRIIDSGDVLKNGNFNKGYFTKIDIRTDKDIALYSKSAKMLTNHPSGSYVLEKDANGLYSLHITNPQQFWSISKYLVVQVK
ncbi:MAG: hypothetical protein KBT12_07960 [Bacteroidales bacterium]|nr:hypothetical protein [Candidatus Physcousia equi]